jgi:hypothetical protein
VFPGGILVKIVVICGHYPAGSRAKLESLRSRIDEDVILIRDARAPIFGDVPALLLPAVFGAGRMLAKESVVQNILCAHAGQGYEAVSHTVGRRTIYKYIVKCPNIRCRRGTGRVTEEQRIHVYADRAVHIVVIKKKVTET